MIKSMPLKHKEREKINHDVEAFLSSGGKITQVDNGVSTYSVKKGFSYRNSSPITAKKS